ncbi:MAG: phosphatidylglycerophosphatase A [Candidatus Omnitrophica bacterium]|nr:phosphatidylglycerophosphatase A [Candidatus Omnitrophota bacterium]
MPRLARAIATVGELGSSARAPGTIGSAVGWLIGLLWLAHAGAAVRLWVVVGGTVAGVMASTRTERDLKRHDPSCVIIDEVIGMAAVFALMPAIAQSVWKAGIAFGLFRWFDILKPPPLKWLSRFPAGWGIVLDDLGATAYVCASLWVAAAMGW